jgi:hypothetical protein
VLRVSLSGGVCVCMCQNVALFGSFQKSEAKQDARTGNVLIVRQRLSLNRNIHRGIYSKFLRVDHDARKSIAGDN